MFAIDGYLEGIDFLHGTQTLARQLYWKKRALQMSCYNIGDVEQALSQQSIVKVSLTKCFNGSTELPSSALELSGRAALEAAKKRRIAKKASILSKIIVGIGEVRATREWELMWSPIFKYCTKWNFNC